MTTRAPTARARASAFVAGALALAFLVGAGAARAAREPADFTLERFHPALDRDGVLGVESGAVPDHLDWDAALFVGYAHDPVVVYSVEPDGRRVPVGSFVGHRVGASLLGAVSLFDWVHMGVEAPLVLLQTRGALPDDLPMGPLAAVGVGDLRLLPKVRVLRAAEQFVDLAVVPVLTVPTGLPDREYMGEKFFTLEPMVAISRRLGSFRLAADVGARLRPATRYANVTLGSEVFYRAGAAYDLAPDFGAPVELQLAVDGGSSMLPVPTGSWQAPLELQGGVAVRVFERLQIVLGMGAGVLRAMGVPDVRGFAGVRWSTRSQDLDRDGVADDVDRCAGSAEDVDGFADGDGCPDPDNDGDGVLDAVDRCGDVAGTEGNYGCPASDQDGDGLSDLRDRCPDVAGLPRHAGCPPPDGDGDTLADEDDRCPTQQGPVENGGCPVLDADGDGLPDGADRCVYIAGPSALGGCPDRDGDGIADLDDLCPDGAGPKERSGCAEGVEPQRPSPGDPPAALPLAPIPTGPKMSSPPGGGGR